MRGLVAFLAVILVSLLFAGTRPRPSRTHVVVRTTHATAHASTGATASSTTLFDAPLKRVAAVWDDDEDDDDDEAAPIGPLPIQQDDDDAAPDGALTVDLAPAAPSGEHRRAHTPAQGLGPSTGHDRPREQPPRA